MKNWIRYFSRSGKKVHDVTNSKTRVSKFASHNLIDVSFYRLVEVVDEDTSRTIYVGKSIQDIGIRTAQHKRNPCNVNWRHKIDGVLEIKLNGISPPFKMTHHDAYISEMCEINLREGFSKNKGGLYNQHVAISKVKFEQLKTGVFNIPTINNKIMDYPKFIFQDIYWSFSIGNIATIEEFISELEAYHKDVSGQKFPLVWDKIIFDFPKLELQYVKYANDEIEELYELVESDNGINFTVKELLYKINKVGINLQNDDNCYFEGLEYSNGENEDVPIYFLLTGS